MKEGKLTIPGVGISRQNSMQMLREIVGMTGEGSELTVFSYSVTDGWLRQLMKLKEEMAVKRITLVLDRDVMIRHREKLEQIRRVADEAWLTDSHAKVYLSQGRTRTIALITSANATNNYRTECHYGTDRPAETGQIERDIGAILEASDRIVP